ncbi:MAG: TadE family protein [Pseudomonadota bacterium]|uniref:TadE/TadG family type IV pilus assembly protein n=1 Tax=Sphingobium naphthae TaxID=1886786 RepID=UPI002B1A6EEE|nr:TadE family protein [Pseudomonadota bacterium]
MRHLRALIKSQAGLSTVEFAILLPALLTLICGSIELGHMLFARVVLEGAMTEAARISTASMETAEAQRTAIMEESIEQAMRFFPLAAGAHVGVETTVYSDFSSAHPETYEDANENGQYDLGETYVDRNANGKWDAASPISGTLGGPGDVVSYTVHFPKRILFGFLGMNWLMGDRITLNATTVVRNESVVRRTS